jgi:hypothetical protein
MCRLVSKATSGLAALLLIGLAGCVDLDVVNPNDPDAGRALNSPGDVEALIGGAFSRWTNVGDYNGPTMFLSVASGEHVAPWGNARMEEYGRIPRVPTNNVAGAPEVIALTFAWFESYGAIAAVRDGLKQIDAGVVDLGTDGNLRAHAYGKFMQGLAHATLAVLYDSAFVYDETVDPATVKLKAYPAVMAAALGYFADAATLAGSGSFTVPAAWMSKDVSSATLAQLAHSMAARFRAALARTPAERAAVDWNAVVADVNAGIIANWDIIQDCNTGTFCNLLNDAVIYRLVDGWNMQNNWVAGMADTSGAYQAWITTPLLDKQPFILHTPDTRWPSGADETTQLANPGDYYSMNSGDTRIWARPDRGTWRWSYYEQTYEPFYTFGSVNFAGTIPLITVEEMNALKAEAAYRAGTMQPVADFVNATRTTHGLLATDAAGTNTNCVPKLPNGTCGDLWEMFKWEKRLETQFAGPLRVGWYFDGRGWGDLMAGTILQLPVPYREIQLLSQSPYNFGGVGGAYGAPLGTYGY